MAAVVPEVDLKSQDVKKIVKKRKSPDKMMPVLSKRFDEYTAFDVFDFIQFKTQMKIVKFQQSENTGRIIKAKLPVIKKTRVGHSHKPSKAGSKKPKSTPKKKKKTQIVRHVSTEKLDSFMKEHDVISAKKARAMIKAKEYITAFLEKHPDIPVEKSHKKMRLLRTSEDISPNVKSESSITSSKATRTPKILPETDPIVSSHSLKSWKLAQTAKAQKLAEEMEEQQQLQQSNQISQQIPLRGANPSVTSVKRAVLNNSKVPVPTSVPDDPNRSHPLQLSPDKNLNGKNGNNGHITQGSNPSLQQPQQPSPQHQAVDQVAAINNWINKNYDSLTPPQKQLVHMQLQYLNNLKKTSFQNQAFILSPQHLNNLNNLAFLTAHYGPYNNNYNFVNVPGYSTVGVDINKQLLQALQQSQHNQQQQNVKAGGYSMQIPVGYTLNGNNAQKHGGQNPHVNSVDQQSSRRDRTDSSNQQDEDSNGD